MASVLRRVMFKTQSRELQFRHKSINPWIKYYIGSENGGFLWLGQGCYKVFVISQTKKREIII